MLVALAGPCTNFLLALFFAGLLWLSLTFIPPTFWHNYPSCVLVLQAFKAGVYINLCLAWLNLIPIPPLDGSRVVAFFLPTAQAIQYMRLERYGFLILMVLLFTKVLDKILTPLIIGSANVLLAYLKLM